MDMFLGWGQTEISEAARYLHRSESYRVKIAYITWSHEGRKIHVNQMDDGELADISLNIK